MSLIKKLKGTGVAVVTPFKNDLSIDFDAIKKLVDFLINNGIKYIVVQGTTGESSTMSHDEKIISREAFVKANNNRIPLVLGFGSNDTNYLLNDLKKTDFTGYSAILSVTPYYNKPTMNGLFNHFSLLAKSSTLPIILYNVPSRTGCNMLPYITIKLANEFENIIGIKEASGDLDQVKELITNSPNDFLIISGDDNTAYQSVLMGGDGVISVAAGCIPNEFSEIIRMSFENNVSECKSKFKIIKPLLDFLFEEGNPSGVKAALSFLNLCQNNLRLPLIPVSNQLKTKIQNSITKIKKDY
ncbi:4-hydroxy-tetrahydrodipicolinate synthase [Flavobacteriaceae bacterium]|nr:4-hydroxy-tetrahydrodipicolinate synthase [Flavobacteriaceae bacterium]